MSAIGLRTHQPPCFHDVLLCIHENYGPKAIHIAENGMATGIGTFDANGEIVDLQRPAYHVDHIEQINRTRERGVPVKGHFAWR